MPIANFPDRIQVTLGTNFGGGGNGLNQGDVLVLTKQLEGAAVVVYSEDGTSSPDPATNRLKLRIESDAVALRLYLLDSANSFFATAIYMNMGISTTYSFLSVWNGAISNSPYTYWDVKAGSGYGGSVRSSWQYTTSRQTTARSFWLWNVNTFSTFEEWVDPRPPKTTYPYA